MSRLLLFSLPGVPRPPAMLPWLPLSLSLIYTIKSGRFSCVNSQQPAPNPAQAWHQCCHLSLATQRHISKEGCHHPYKKIFAQIGPAGICQPVVPLRFFHWDASNIPWRLCTLSCIMESIGCMSHCDIYRKYVCNKVYIFDDPGQVVCSG